ncbi:MAG: IS66 family transposase [Acetobacteraceae bacterium]
MPVPLDPTTLSDDVSELRSLLLQPEAEHAAELQAAREGLKEQVLRNEQLKLRLSRLLRERFGHSSERLRAAIGQLELLQGDIEEEIAETVPVDAEQPSEPAAGESVRRKPLPERLPRVTVQHDVPCTCPECGGALRPLGEDVTEVLDYVPGSFRVLRHVRPKLSCRTCESIAQAPAPELPIRRGLASAGLLAHVLVAKYCDHLPLYRQAEIYARSGIELDRSTLADWVGQSARLLYPLVEAVGAHVMAAERLHADDTPVPVLDPGRGKTKTGRLWCYVRDDQPFGGRAPPAAFYRYSPDRKGEHPRQHLATFRGILQADGYAGFARLYERGVAEAACWAHTRRNFFEVQAATSSPLAQEVLRQIAALYAIEINIRGQPPESRLHVRLAQSAPLLSGIKQRLEHHLGRISGKSGLAGAIRYALTRWNALTLVLSDGRACLDNNAAERSIRPLCLGRKNWLFAGSDEGASCCSSRHAIESSGRFCWRSSGAGRRDRRASAWWRTSARFRSEWRMIQGPPLQCWRAARRPLAIRRRTVDLLTAKIVAASSSVASPRSARSPSR